MHKYSIQEVLEQAVQTEKLGCQLYLGMAKKFEKDDKLRKLFEILAVKEQEHERTFSDLKEKATDREVDNWEEVSNYLRAIVESEFFLGNNKSLTSLDGLKDVEDAVRYALGFEKETLLYYHAIQDMLRENDVLTKLINEERSHIVWLDEYRKSITR
jgi:rubrerythrin